MLEYQFVGQHSKPRYILFINFGDFIVTSALARRPIEISIQVVGTFSS